MQNFTERVVSALSSGQVDFIVVGGVSAVLQGAPIVTRDLDLCYGRASDNLRRLAEVLAPFQLRLRGLPEGVPNTFDERSLQLGMNFTLEAEDESLDLLGEMSAIGGYEAIVGRAIEMEVAGHSVKVLALADLIRTKRAAGRPKDLAVLPVLEATLQMLHEKGGAEEKMHVPLCGQADVIELKQFILTNKRSDHERYGIDVDAIGKQRANCWSEMPWTGQFGDEGEPMNSATIHSLLPLWSDLDRGTLSLAAPVLAANPSLP